MQAAFRRRRPVKMQKIEQLVRLVKESHEQPMTGEPRRPEIAGAGETGVTFLGHSSFLLQIGGKNILVDPVFSTRLIVLRRQRRPGVLVRDLPPIDLVLVTHAHMDHLDKASLRRVVRATRRLRGTGSGKGPEIVVPHGVEDLVEWMGFERVHALSWWESLELDGLTITMTPCKHWGARMFRDMHREYGGYFIAPAGEGMTVYHSGDTAYFGGFKEIGERLRPDVALLPIGAYFPDSHRTVHTSPEEAVRGFVECGAKWMIPMHFGTFRLGREPMEEPVQRLNADAIRLGIEGRVRVLAEGETMLVSASGSVLPSRKEDGGGESPSRLTASYEHG
jgi:L-ascorbate metabolism protein UlaG (beta-lactamase superfamily)